MKKNAITLLLAYYIFSLSAQVIAQGPNKPPIDTAMIFNWPSIPEWPYPSISSNGEYAMYTILNVPQGSHTTMIYSLNNHTEIALVELKKAVFSSDNEHLFFQKNDSLFRLKLSSQEKMYLASIKSFELFINNGNEWLICRNDSNTGVILRNLQTSNEIKYKNIKNYTLSDNKKIILLEEIIQTRNYNELSVLIWHEFSTNKTKEIWKGKSIDAICFDSKVKHLAILGQPQRENDKTIWIYTAGDEKARKLVSNHSPIMINNMEIDGINNFNRDGSKLVLQLKRSAVSYAVPYTAYPNIWSYGDGKLQSQKPQGPYEQRPSYLAAINTHSPDHIWQIQQENEIITKNNNSNTLLLTYRKGESSESYWSKSAQSTTYLVTLTSEKKRLIPLAGTSISPEEKFLIGYENEQRDGDLYAYNISQGQMQNLTRYIPKSTPSLELDVLWAKNYSGFQLAGWLPNDTALLIYDSYDIWKVSLFGKKKPINLTNGKHKRIRFRLAYEEDISNTKIPQLENSLLLSAFNRDTKDQGFYELDLNESPNPKPLFMGSIKFSTFTQSDFRSHFLKASGTEVFLVKIEQSNMSPNIYSTTDFKSFEPVSRVHPEQQVNWFTSELINFTTPDGIKTKAILYKPDNFDSTKKYPLIIHYYDKKSDQLNQYQAPGVSDGGDLDIAWFASHEYLVALTDIHYTIGRTGESVCNAVTGLSEYISKRPYVNKSRIGVQGHSFGGYETNYLIAHIPLFAAAVSSSGISNLVSDYGNLWPSNTSKQEYWEMRSGRLGIAPWENPKIYVENSPIFSVDNVKTPILMVQNKLDKNVLFEQGLEFFTALRRAGKRAWMLEYDNGGHGLYGQEYKDYLIRMTQFFDHYLKNAPAPKWMTNSIPASMKGSDSYLSLENELKTPGQGLRINRK